MRLMAEDGKEQPMDMYVRYKNDINEWYKDMRDYGLNEDEIEILKDHLLIDYGVCATQESMMLLTMNEKICNFSVKETNTLRRAIAKKKKKILQEVEKMFYEKGLEIGTRKELLDYVWFVQIGMQKGLKIAL